MSDVTRRSPVIARRGPSRPWTLRGRAYRVFLTLHVLSSVGWFGLAAAVGFCAVRAATVSTPAESATVFRLMAVIPWMTVPVGLVALGSGVVLGLGTKWGVLRHWWVVIKIVIALAVLVTDPLLIARGAHQAAVTGDAPQWLYGPTVAHIVLLCVATVLSIFKPRGLTPRGRYLAARSRIPHPT